MVPGMNPVVHKLRSSHLMGDKIKLRLNMRLIHRIHDKFFSGPAVGSDVLHKVATWGPLSKTHLFSPIQP